MDFVIFLVEGDPERRRALAEAMERALFRVVAVDLHDSAAVEATSEAHALGVSCLGDRAEALAFIRNRRQEGGLERTPLVAIVPPGDPEAEEEALSAGADDVVPWPARDALLRSRLGTATRISRLQKEVERFADALAALVRAAEARDPSRIEHSQRVSELAVAIARQIGCSEGEVIRLRQGALIHDLGMLAIPEEILGKSGPLTRHELAEVRTHPVLGTELLHDLPSIEALRPFIRMHHERIDGSGYPEGLTGRELPVLVQVLSLGDAYDALTSARPYRPIRSHGKALEILWEEAWRGRWDPELLRALERTLAAMEPKT